MIKRLPDGQQGEPAVTGIVVALLRDEDIDTIVDSRVRPATERTADRPRSTARQASADVPALQEPPARRPAS